MLESAVSINEFAQIFNDGNNKVSRGLGPNGQNRCKKQSHKQSLDVFRRHAFGITRLNASDRNNLTTLKENGGSVCATKRVHLLNNTLFDVIRLGRNERRTKTHGFQLVGS